MQTNITAGEQPEFRLGMPEVIKLYLEMAARLVSGSMSGENVLGIYPDEAVDIGIDMVGYALSDRALDRLRDRMTRPEAVAESLDAQIGVILKRLAKTQSGSAERDAAIYAKAFGVPQH